MPLAQILAAFQAAVGQHDRRLIAGRFGQPAADPKLTIRFDKTPFWPALDRVLDQAGLTVYPFSEPGAIDVVARGRARNGSPAPATACYSGPFRFEALQRRWPVAISASRTAGRWW